MPTLRKLDPEEKRAFEAKQKGLRSLIVEEYDRALADFSVGDYGVVTVEPSEKRATVINRLKAAAQRKGVATRFLRGTADQLRFRIEQAKPQPPQPTKKVARSAKQSTQPAAVESAVPSKRKSGRPRKTNQ